MHHRWKLLALLGCLVVSGCKPQVEPPARPAGRPPLVVDVVRIEPRPLRDTLSATGSLLAREEVSLEAERAGVVREIRFEEGRPVEVGQVLVVLDDSELAAQLERARAQLELATAIELRDRELLASGGLVSQLEYDRSLASLNIARAEIALIEAQLAKTRMVAPFDGVAGLRRVSVGAFLTPGTPVLSVRDVSSLRLDFTLPERYRRHLEPGQSVEFRVDGDSGRFPATIFAIEPGVDEITRSIRVRALAPNDAGRLMPGAFAQVEVPIADIPEAILIPPIALIPGLKQQSVFVHRNGEVEARLVETGLRTADAVQILSGLEAGEEVVASGILELRPGMRVRARLVGAGAEGAKLEASW
jgi:membrane fusion protein, multidrug efflux system